MAEQKKTFGLILKNGQTKKQKEEKKLYTIISCCVSAIFLITIIVPLMSGSKERASAGQGYKSVAFDLADLAVDDEAEKVLLEMQKYSDIPQQKIAGGLFDKKDKEARQETDKKEGVSAAPDAEYKKARQVKQAKKGVSRTPIYSSKSTAKTSTGSLAKGGMVSASGGSSGTSATIWTSADKSGQKGAKGATQSGTFGTQQLVAATGAKGRANSLVKAIEESQKGANSQNTDTAAQAASDAFTNNNLEAEDEGLADGMDDLAEAFNADAFKRAVNDQDLEDLKNEAEKEKEKQEKETDPCSQVENKMSFECYWGPALADLAMTLVKSMGQAAIDAAFNSDGSAAISRNENWLRKNCSGCFDSNGQMKPWDQIQSNYGSASNFSGIQRHYNRYQTATNTFNRLNSGE